MSEFNFEAQKALVDAIGAKNEETIKAHTAAMERIVKEAKDGNISEKAFNEKVEADKVLIEKLETALKEQGTKLCDVIKKMETHEADKAVGLGELMEHNRDEIMYASKHKSFVEFELKTNSKGEMVALRKEFSEAYSKHLETTKDKARSLELAKEAFERTNKAAGVTGTVDLLSGAGSISSIASALTSDAILRAGGSNANGVISQFRNQDFITALCNTRTVPITQSLAAWIEETTPQFNVGTVAEGAAKPISQTSYTLKNSSYIKKAHVINITDEFMMDFSLLENEIRTTGLLELSNAIQTDVITDMFAQATAYNTATQFKGGVVVPNVNDYDAIAALAAQSRYATFGSYPNGVLTGSFKRDRMGITKDSTGNYVGMPENLRNLQIIGNRAVDVLNIDNVLVGDFKQYNLQFRGGVIVRVGHNGTDLIENKITTVIEQYYWRYIPAIKAAALVKGSTFATVKTAIST